MRAGHGYLPTSRGCSCCRAGGGCGRTAVLLARGQMTLRGRHPSLSRDRCSCRCRRRCGRPTSNDRWRRRTLSGCGGRRTSGFGGAARCRSSAWTWTVRRLPCDSRSCSSSSSSSSTHWSGTGRGARLSGSGWGGRSPHLRRPARDHRPSSGRRWRGSKRGSCLSPAGSGAGRSRARATGTCHRTPRSNHQRRRGSGRGAANRLRPRRRRSHRRDVPCCSRPQHRSGGPFCVWRRRLVVVACRRLRLRLIKAVGRSVMVANGKIRNGLLSIVDTRDDGAEP